MGQRTDAPPLSRSLPLPPSRPLSPPAPPSPEETECEGTTNTTNADKSNDASEADSRNEGSECKEKEILKILNEKNDIHLIKIKDRSKTDTKHLAQLKYQLTKYDSKMVAQFKKRGQRTDAPPPSRPLPLPPSRPLSLPA